MKSTVNVKKGKTQVIPFFTFAFFPMVHSPPSDVPLSTNRCYSLHPTGQSGVGISSKKNLGLNVVQMKEIHYLCADKS
jgi:hypothetical protein